jgi:hypothetical protein
LLKKASLPEENWSFADYLKKQGKGGDDYDPTWSVYLDYLDAVLQYVWDQRLPKPNEGSGERDRFCKSKSDIRKSIAAARASVAATDDLYEVAGEMKQIASSLSGTTKSDLEGFAQVWGGKFKRDNVQAILTELTRAKPNDKPRSLLQSRDQLSELLKALPQNREGFGRVWLKMEFEGLNCTLIEFKDLP